MPNSNVNLPSRSLIDRLASCRVVLWALNTHGPRLTELFDEPQGQPLPEGLTTGFQPVVKTLVDVLTEARDRLTASDRTRRDQEAQVIHYRQLRDEAFKNLSPFVVGLRDTFLGACGLGVVSQLGFARRTPQQPGDLFEQAQHLTARLSDPDLVLPAPRYQGVLLDAPELAVEMQPLVEKLGETLEHVSREERMFDAAKIAKDEALEVYDRNFLWAARTAESLFRLANLPEVAKRVRPSTRRPGLTNEVENEGSGTTGSQLPADGSSSEAPASPEASAEATPTLP